MWLQVGWGEIIGNKFAEKSSSQFIENSVYYMLHTK